MSFLVKPGDFFQAVSQSSRLKFNLVWFTFLGLIVPTAFLMSMGVPEKYALPLMLAAILPFQYAVFCILYGMNRNDRPVVAKRASKVIHAIGELATAYLRTQRKYRSVQTKSSEGDLLKLQLEQLKTAEVQSLGRLWQAQLARPLERDLLKLQLEQLKREVQSLGRLLQAPPDIKSDVAKKIRPLEEASFQACVESKKVAQLHLMTRSSYAKLAAFNLSTNYDALFVVLQVKKQSRDAIIHLQRTPLERRIEFSRPPSELTSGQLQ